jgi:flagellar P-ring protein precursor FlgI
MVDTLFQFWMVAILMPEYHSTFFRFITVTVLACCSLFQPVNAERIKDLTSIGGVRSNPLLGYGLVVGLDGSGDQTSQTPFTVQSMKSMLARYGISIPPNINPQLKNVAAVTIQAILPAFTRPGQSIDITVSSIGNAKSLRGGSLLMSPLKGADGQVYAIAQGELVVGGLGVEGGDGSRIAINIPSVGRIPNGAMVERAVPNAFNTSENISLYLHSADFTTAKRLEQAINKKLGVGIARAIDAVSIEVRSPKSAEERVAYLSYIENLELDPGDAPAKVIINSRTGTIVIGSHVTVMPAAVTHGSMTVTITADPIVSQPEALSNGETVVVPRTELSVEEEASHMFLFDRGVTLNEIVRAINRVGAAPGDLVAILEALKQAGALRAQLVVI